MNHKGIRKLITNTTKGASLLLVGAGVGMSVNYLVNTPELFARANDNEILVSQSSPSQFVDGGNINFVSKVVQDVGRERVQALSSVTMVKLSPMLT